MFRASKNEHTYKYMHIARISNKDTHTYIYIYMWIWKNQIDIIGPMTMWSGCMIEHRGFMIMGSGAGSWSLSPGSMALAKRPWLGDHDPGSMALDSGLMCPPRRSWNLCSGRSSRLRSPIGDPHSHLWSLQMLSCFVSWCSSLFSWSVSQRSNRCKFKARSSSKIALSPTWFGVIVSACPHVGSQSGG